MFLIDLTFTQPLDVVDEHVQAHREYLTSFYASGVLIFGGRKHPRTGGIILARHDSREAVTALFDADPLVKANVACYSVTEFEPVMRAKAFEGLI